ncbi:biopolymer transporter ExbD [Myxococcus sp. CA051A]|uniref:Biopolymer transporter ExbD n=1 Tax=Myxococcus llanfairpwllgwyngyllgogerychwyrndrobwllllantysiliogogogochensis TaxID=2590453 RepID=A0A540WN66_9BACT|nr:MULTISPECIES: biopolymer transporter ExbD [Myxococcus]NTX04903.1 biopolymer transporter ExbD [Myxococcus sp. CA040A]NTX15254.1 biopolymer transporter ExbD [Myxococcus sp. CA056]NTX37992.1 biopolymer transporter ExbD [Myxococcus sp. CA033]NTX56414.1 biopolymer transporter ExbD [Myxococcus sp. CA039A]NTX61641.1 biopolymer transporter ExbD [Myxococcus sp. CA051A]
MGMSAGPKGGIKSEINVTPLVDVVLVLLIIFMVVTPMLQRGKSVELPKATEIEKEKGKDSDPLYVSITPDKKVFLENDQVDEQALQDRLTQELAKDPGKKILLKGDNTVNVGDVRRVLDVARKAKAKQIALGVEEKK